MAQFRDLVSAHKWVEKNAQGPCTVVVHGDPYEVPNLDEGYMVRRYPTEFYLRRSR